MHKISFSKNPKVQELVNKSKHINYLSGVLSLLEWDQEVMMPSKAAQNRANQMALLSEIAHNALTDSKNAELIKDVTKELNSSEEFTDVDKALLREFKRSYDKETKLPVEFVKEFTQHTSKSLESWRKARENSDFSIFKDDLKKMVELSQQKADYYGYKDNVYDALLDIYEPGLTSKEVTSIFEPLKKFTIDLVEKIKNSDVQVNTSILNRNYSISKQFEFSKELAQGIGYDFEAGRLDKSTHPFTTEFGTINDVRITTRFYADEVQASIMATIHETGHALYEQGVSPELDSTVLGTGVSLGLHESQSRMWENLVGRTPEFWDYWFPRFVTYFDNVVNLNEKDAFVSALNRVTPSFIRVEADEVTYNLHIILRYELELALLNGKLAVKDLPEAWNAKMKEYLGITPENDSQGVLQDIHWSMGGMGYFPTYTLGNLYAAQLWNQISKDIPKIMQEIQIGNTSELLKWLRNNLHVYGAIYSPDTLCNKITGESLDPKYLERYLSSKFGLIYNLL